MSALSTVIARGTLGSRPAAGNAGRLYFATGNPTALYRDNGSSWDTMEGNGGAFVGAALFHSTTQSINNITDTKLSMDSETFDADGFHAGGSPTRFAPPSGFTGTYLVAGKASFAGNTTGSTRAVSLYKTGAAINGSGTQLGPDGTAFLSLATPALLVALTGGTDYVELNAYQDSGGALNTGLATSGASNALWGHLVGT